MNDVILVLKEQITNFGMIRRMSKYEEKATYQSHYLGLIWQFLNPAIQVGIYYIVFGLGLNQGRKVDGVPYIVWMLVGIIAWFFLNSTILGGSNSIYRQVNMVSKMKFPISVLPSVNMMSNFFSYRWMMIVMFAVMTAFGVYPTIYWVQYFYYFFCMIVFLFAFSLLNSTITVLVRDYHIMLQSILRLLFYLSGAIWNINVLAGNSTSVKAGMFVRLLELNPLYYIISGFRDTFLSHGWLWQRGTQTLFFWGITLLLLFVGSHLHMKFRARFVDFV